MAKIYSCAEVKLRVSCEDYLRTQGIEVRHGRCRAEWRGGSGDNVAVDGGKWFDHVEKRGGSVIDLCATVQFGGDILRAAQWLGERFNLDPIATTKARPKRTRAEFLIESGYRNTATYNYTDQNGETVYSVLRYEKDEYGPGEKKEFVQCTPQHEGLDKDTPRLPYNLPAVVNSDEVYVVEGEKDVETLRRFGIVGTTNSGGATNWDPSMTKWFKGKNVVVLPDNDEPGRKHGELLVSLLVPVASSVKLVVLSSLPKGDVTDWVEREGGSGTKLREIVSSTRTADAKDTPDVAIAKQANMEPFRNYVEVRDGKSTRNMPLTVGALVDECFRRFLGYPRRLGSVLFDWVKDERRIQYLENSNALVAWMGSVSRHPVDWAVGQGFVTKDVFYEAMMQHAKQYVSVSSAPHYPSRPDVYYTFGELPEADITHGAWNKLVSMFSPCNDANRILLATFLAAPLFYSAHADRPLWIIDTEDQQGSGKTSLVKLCALLYGSEYMGVSASQLDRDPEKVYRRMLSSDARRKRIFLIDNVTKEIRSEILASLVTESYITGVAPYGRGEESRPNDMTYVVTVNNANINADIASRAYTVRLKKVAEPDPLWFDKTAKFICENRLHIISALIHKIETNRLREVRRRSSRFGLFDATILTAICASEEEVRMADEAIRQSNENANTDADHGQEFADLFREAMLKADGSDIAIRVANHLATAEDIARRVDYSRPIFISTQDVDYLLSHSDGELKKWKSRDVLGLVRNGHVPGFDKTVQRIGNGKYSCLDGETPIPRYRGFLFRGSQERGRVDAQVIRRAGGRSFEVIGVVPFGVADAAPQTAPSSPSSAWGAEVVATRETTVRETVSVSVKDRVMAAAASRTAARSESVQIQSADLGPDQVEAEFM